MPAYFRFLLLSVLALCAGAASAFAPAPTYTGANWGQGVWHSSGGAACSAAAANRGAAVGSGYSNFTGTYTPPSCNISATNSAGTRVESWGGDTILQGPLACPSNSTTASGNCTCNTGFVEQGGQCVDKDQQCKDKQGTSSVINVTSGWQRTPSASANEDWLFPTKVLNSAGVGSVCSGGCTQSIDAAEPCPECGGYVSQVPNAQGLYRVSTDFRGHYSGASCSGDSAGTVPSDSADPACPGFVGEVNGVKGCYGTADKPVRPEAPPPPLDKAPKDKGNPAAGQKPSSGAGSGSGGAGRTPGTGTGGSAGGPAGAAAGSGNKPDGKTDKPEEGKEQQNCGAPGQPKCSIDESGNPQPWGADKWDSKISDYRKKSDDALAQIKGSGDSTFSGFSGYFFAPPIAACEPFILPNDQGEITRHCEVVDGVRSAMAYIWALAALWLCLGWIKKATA